MKTIEQIVKASVDGIAQEVRSDMDARMRVVRNRHSAGTPYGSGPVTETQVRALAVECVQRRADEIRGAVVNSMVDALVAEWREAKPTGRR